MAVEVTRLPSGLRVVTDAIEGVESAAVGVWVGVGTRYEPAEVNGVSHFLEHMAFKGTGRRSASDIAREIEAVGGHLNAYTSRETTAYYARVLKEDVPLALDLLGDILQHATFEPDELERERSVILQEIGQALDTPEDVVFDAFQETAYPAQSLGRSVLGDPDVIRAMPRKALTDYLAGEYHTPRMVVSAAGGVSHAAVVDMVERFLADLPQGTPSTAAAGRYAGGEARIARDLEQVHLTLGWNGVAVTDPDYYALQTLSTLYGGGMSSRLFQEVREKRGLVYSIYSFASALSDGGLFGVYAGTGEGEANDVMAIVCDELGGLAGSVAEDEVARARAQLKASLLMSRESTSQRAEQAASQLLVFGRPVPTAEIVAKIDAVDVAAVSRVAARLVLSPPTVAVIGQVDALEGYDRIAARLS